MVKSLRLGVVDQDHRVPAIKLKEMFQAVAANARTFSPIWYDDQASALQDLREGEINGVLEIPPEFSRKLLAGDNPQVALIEDNTDQFSSSALEGVLNALVTDYGQPAVTPRVVPATSLSVVEVYPYVPYIQFLLPGTIALAIFVSAMIGGGIIFIDDKARGLHEGYLVTPISKFELILGFTLSGAIKAILSGVVLVTVGSIIAGIPDPLNLARMARMFLLVVVTSLALISMMFLFMVRVSDPLVPRAIFGVLNTVLYLPQRRGLSHPGLPWLDESDHGRRPVYLCRARVQVAGAQEHRAAGDQPRPAVPERLHGAGDGGGHGTVPADFVTFLPPRRIHPKPDLPAVSRWAAKGFCIGYAQRHGNAIGASSLKQRRSSHSPLQVFLPMQLVRQLKEQQQAALHIRPHF